MMEGFRRVGRSFSGDGVVSLGVDFFLGTESLAEPVNEVGPAGLIFLGHASLLEGVVFLGGRVLAKDRRVDVRGAGARDRVNDQRAWKVLLAVGVLEDADQLGIARPQVRGLADDVPQVEAAIDLLIALA